MSEISQKQLMETARVTQDLSKELGRELFQLFNYTKEKSLADVELKRIDKESILEKANFEDLKPVHAMKRGVNGVYYLYLNNELLPFAMAKPAQEEQTKLLEDMWVKNDFGALSKREVLTYQTSRSLGFDIVPVTILRTLEEPTNKGVCSIQEYVLMKGSMQPFTRRSLEEASIVDVVTKQFDRKFSNFGIDAQTKKLVVFDNGACFPKRPEIIKKLRTLETITQHQASQSDLKAMELHFDANNAPRTQLSISSKMAIDRFMSKNASQTRDLLKQMFHILLGEHGLTEFENMLETLDEMRFMGLKAYKYASRDEIDDYKFKLRKKRIRMARKNEPGR